MKLLIVLILISSGCFAQPCTLQIDPLTNGKKIISDHIVSGVEAEAVNVSFVKDSVSIYMNIKLSQKNKDTNSVGAFLIFDTLKIEKPNAKVSAKVDYYYLNYMQYNAIFPLTMDELRLLSVTPLRGCRIYKFDRTFSDSAKAKIIAAAKCMLDIILD